MTENCKLRKAILSAFYNISQRNFGILLILWCSFKLWWNFCLDQNLVYYANGQLFSRFHITSEFRNITAQTGVVGWARFCLPQGTRFAVSFFILYAWLVVRLGSVLCVCVVGYWNKLLLWSYSELAFLIKLFDFTSGWRRVFKVYLCVETCSNGTPFRRQNGVRILSARIRLYNTVGENISLWCV
jgi:hypothetical protein